MTEQELTTLAKQTLDWPGRGRPHYAIQLAAGYLDLLAEREALRAQLEATRTLAASGLGRQLHTPPSEPVAPAQTRSEVTGR